MVEIDETEDENDGWPKVTENQTNHVVATGINLDSSRRSVSQGAAQKTAREKMKKRICNNGCQK